MMGGFAVLAWPVHYGETGVSTFMISNDSDVYEKDLGEQTTQRAAGDHRLQSRQEAGKRPAMDALPGEVVGGARRERPQ